MRRTGNRSTRRGAACGRVGDAGGGWREERVFERAPERAGEPCAERHGEAALGTVERLIEFAREAVAEDELAGAVGRQLEGGWHAGSEFGDAQVEDRGAQLDGRAHAHLVGFLEQRFGELPVEVEREQLAERVALRAVDFFRNRVRPLAQSPELKGRESARRADVAGQALDAERERLAGARLVGAGAEALPARGLGGGVGRGEERGETAEFVRALERGEHAEVARVVAREKLVRTLAGEQHFHMLAGEFADLQHGKGGGIADRLVEVPGDALDALQKVVGGEFQRVVLRADFPRCLGRAQCFRIRPAEADGESLHAALQLLRVGDHRAAVEAAAQQHADRDIRAQVHLHRVAERGVERLGGGVELREVGLGGERVAPVFSQLGGAGAGERQREEAAGGEFMNVPEMRARGGEREPGNVVEEGVGIALAAHPPEREQAFQLGGEREARTVAGVVERLLAKVIAGEQEAVLAGVENREAEHAAELREHGVAELLVEMHEHLGVGLGAKGVAAGDEFGAQFAVVVDLAVEDDADRFVLIPDRLRAALQVDDA